MNRVVDDDDDNEGIENIGSDFYSNLMAMC